MCNTNPSKSRGSVVTKSNTFTEKTSIEHGLQDEIMAVFVKRDGAVARPILGRLDTHSMVI